MRSFILAATVVLGAAALPTTYYDMPLTGVTVSAIPLQQEPSSPSTPSSSQPAQPATQPAPAPAPSQPAPEVKIDVQTTSSPSWYANPTWVAIGVIGAVLLIVVLVMATRSGSNTVIRG